MLPYGTFAQKKEEATYTYKPFQISVFPGMGTNGINAGRFKNGVSLNLVPGYSAANNTFEIGGLSNFNQYFSSGIQIAGVKNTIGGDRWLAGKKYNKQELELLKAGFMGIQLSGLSNKLTGDFTGVQLTGGFNLNGGSGSGFQVAGLLNFNQEYFEGVQVSGLINYNGKYTSGSQLAGFLNYSVGDVYGLQLAILNRAKNIYGRKSVLDLGDGVQLGLANFYGNMDGYQVGLINKGKEVKGLQVGLINIYKKNKDGVPIALFN